MLGNQSAQTVCQILPLRRDGDYGVRVQIGDLRHPNTHRAAHELPHLKAQTALAINAEQGWLHHFEVLDPGGAAICK